MTEKAKNTLRLHNKPQYVTNSAAAAINGPRNRVFTNERKSIDKLKHSTLGLICAVNTVTLQHTYVAFACFQNAVLPEVSLSQRSVQLGSYTAHIHTVTVCQCSDFIAFSVTSLPATLQRMGKKCFRTLNATVARRPTKVVTSVGNGDENKIAGSAYICVVYQAF